MINKGDAVFYKNSVYKVLDVTSKTLALEKVIDGQRASALITEVVKINFPVTFELPKEMLATWIGGTEDIEPICKDNQTGI